LGEFVQFEQPVNLNQQLPDLGDIKAGTWLELDGEPGPRGFIDMGPVAKYAGKAQFALKVLGTSMNKVVREGEYVICVAWDELGRGLQDGDLVVVRRERAATYETTLKRARRAKNGAFELWPESDDPRYQKPIALGDGKSEVQVHIIGLVVGIYREP